MTPENARRIANGILATAGAAIALVVWRQPKLRKAALLALPPLVRKIRPVHVAGVIAALAGPVVSEVMAESDAADVGARSGYPADTSRVPAPPTDLR